MIAIKTAQYGEGAHLRIGEWGWWDRVCISNTTTSFEPNVVLCSVSVISLQHRSCSVCWSRQARPPQRVDCLAPRWKTALSVFPKDTAAHYRIGS